LVAEWKKAVVDLYGDDPMSTSDYSRIISPSALKRLASLIYPNSLSVSLETLICQ